MEQTAQTVSKKPKIKLDFKDSKYATGRRKKSIAKVWVKKGSGNIHVNGLKMNDYFKRPVHQIIVTRPLEISEVASNYDVRCSVKGGGLSGQAGAIILGKSNLSEWAYYFCGTCPVGYSATGGQTLNPYGRAIFESGGSSSGSGVSVAANYAVAAVGTETSGSITSPSSQNSVVGLKPTVGLLSRTGIVPISSTLDTPGPMTKNVTDSFILLNLRPEIHNK